MATIRARLRRLLGKAISGEHGLETAVAVMIWPVVLGIVFAVTQGVLWAHGTNLVQSAASNSYNAASLFGATEADGISAGQGSAARSGSMLSNVEVTVVRTATEVTATVTANIPTLIPGTNVVTKTVTGPTERWVQ